MPYVITREKPDVEIHTDQDWAHFTTPYHWEEFVDGIKVIPYKARNYDPETHTWSVRIEHLDTLVALVTESFKQPTIVARQGEVEDVSE